MPQMQSDEPKSERKPLRQRLAWLVFIWCASVLSLILVAYLLRLLMSAAGLNVPQ